jgi:hypothetical protein
VPASNTFDSLWSATMQAAILSTGEFELGWWRSPGERCSLISLA